MFSKFVLFYGYKNKQIKILIWTTNDKIYLSFVICFFKY